MILNAVENASAHDFREDTWSLGVCNGCQLMALLGWVPGTAQTMTGRLSDVQQPRFIHNRSNRFESRWSLVTIKQSPAVMLKVRSLLDACTLLLSFRNPERGFYQMTKQNSCIYTRSWCQRLFAAFRAWRAQHWGSGVHTARDECISLISMFVTL